MKRKITSILAADVVEFSRLAAEDEEDTLARLVSAQAVFGSHVASHGGRIFNTAGDAILAEFPSAVEAVRAALAIQDGWRAVDSDAPDARRLWFRMGIGIGDVVEHGSDLLGDGVNIAARLQTLAPAGGLALSHWVQEQITGKVHLPLIDIGLQDLKNIPKPVRVAVIDPAGQWDHDSAPAAADGSAATHGAPPPAPSPFLAWLSRSRTIVGLGAAFAVGLGAVVTLRPKRTHPPESASAVVAAAPVQPAPVAPIPGGPAPGAPGPGAPGPVLAGGSATPAEPAPSPHASPVPGRPASVVVHPPAATPPSSAPAPSVPATVTPAATPVEPAAPVRPAGNPQTASPASEPSTGPSPATHTALPSALPAPAPSAPPTSVPLPKLPTPVALPVPPTPKVPDEPQPLQPTIIVPPVVIDPPDFATVPPSLKPPAVTAPAPVQPASTTPNETAEPKRPPAIKPAEAKPEVKPEPKPEPKRLLSIEKRTPPK